MNSTALLGAALVLAGGILQGTFAVPMKYARKWAHENIWVVFCLTGMVIFPWLLTASAVPSLARVYASDSSGTLLAIVSFGILWGVGATLTGLGLRMLGIGLGLAIILGLSASVGSLVPLLALTPEKMFSTQGTYYLAGTLVMFTGLALVAVAGLLRERSSDGAGRAGRASFTAGLLVCIASGVLSSTLNFSRRIGRVGAERRGRPGDYRRIPGESAVLCPPHAAERQLQPLPAARLGRPLAAGRDDGGILVRRPGGVRHGPLPHGLLRNRGGLAFAHGRDHRQQQRRRPADRRMAPGGKAGQDVPVCGQRRDPGRAGRAGPGAETVRRRIFSQQRGVP
jgi:hypothetical protein